MSHSPLPSRLEGLQYSENILEIIGNTPLVRLGRMAADVPPVVVGKLEFLNPGGSVKDRIGISMIEAAVEKGQLVPGGTIIECTSGNTGVGLALAARILGYKAIFCMPDKVSTEKVNLLKAYGAEVILSPTAVPPESPDSYYSVARRLERERPNAVLTNQYDNPANPAAHVRTTGPEIWEQTDGKIDAFVASMGTGGTITGCARYLKEKNPDIKIIGADPVGSILKEYFDTGKIGEAHTYMVEGIGEDFIPKVYDFSLIDEVIAVSDRDSLNLTRRLAREEAILCGGSAGTALSAALTYARKMKEDQLMVIMLPDTGERYLSKVHSDEWMRDNHLLDFTQTRVADVLDGKVSIGEMPPVLSIGESEPVRNAVQLVKTHEISQIPVVRDKEVVGTVYDAELLKLVIEDSSVMDKPIKEVMDKPLPEVRRDEPVSQAARLLAKRNSAVLVRENGSVVGILTRYDIIEYISE